MSLINETMNLYHSFLDVVGRKGCSTSPMLMPLLNEHSFYHHSLFDVVDSLFMHTYQSSFGTNQDHLNTRIYVASVNHGERGKGKEAMKKGH